MLESAGNFVNARTTHAKRQVAPRVALAVILLVPAAALRAQERSVPAADPFAAFRADLDHAVDAELRDIREPGRRAFGIGQSANLPSPAESATRSLLFSHVGFQEIAGIQRRFLAAGVDAAKIFTEEGVPLELLAIAQVESRFDPRALSPKGALGLWQLMPATAARFGLRVDAASDERLQPQPSTRAAARYLRELHQQFGDWPLALAAYNAGESRVARAIELAGVRDFRELSRRGLLPAETRNYVPSVLAAVNLLGNSNSPAQLESIREPKFSVQVVYALFVVAKDGRGASLPER